MQQGENKHDPGSIAAKRNTVPKTQEAVPNNHEKQQAQILRRKPAPGNLDGIALFLDRDLFRSRQEGAPFLTSLLGIVRRAGGRSGRQAEDMFIATVITNIAIRLIGNRRFPTTGRTDQCDKFSHNGKIIPRISFCVIIARNRILDTLFIQRGGGTGPVKPRQPGCLAQAPANNQGANSVRSRWVWKMSMQ